MTLAKNCLIAKDRWDDEAKNINNDMSQNELQDDAKLSIDGINGMNRKFQTVYRKDLIQHKYYDRSPYCTVYIFEDKCFYIPNITKNKPNLPVIVYSCKSQTYEDLKEYALTREKYATNDEPKSEIC